MRTADVQGACEGRTGPGCPPPSVVGGFFVRHGGLPPKTHNQCTSAKFLEGLLQYLQFQEDRAILGCNALP